MTLRWSSNLWLSYIVTFGELDQQTSSADKQVHSQYSSMSSVMIGFMDRNILYDEDF